MTQIRTDLALEAAENLQAGGPAAGELSGVVTRTERRQGVSVTEVRILDETGARALGKPVGRYVTMELEEQPFSQQAACLASLLAELLPRGPVLTAGIGNRDMTCDAIGPTAVDHLLVTRHLVRSGQEPFRGMGELSALCTEVLGRTGMETCELIRAAAGAVRPAAVVAVDALAARSTRRLNRTIQITNTGIQPGSGVGSPRRLCRTVQLSDTGLIPGSGVGSHRTAVDRETVGVPVIAVGVPTVIDGAALGSDTEAAPQGLYVTPRDIDRQVRQLGRLLGYGISLAVQPGLTAEDLAALAE